MGTKFSKKKRKKTEVRRLVPFLDVEVYIDDDERCSFSGITCLNGGKIVVTDYLSHHVKYYDTKSLTLLDYIKMDSPPYEVCRTSGNQNEVYVSLPFDFKIIHLSVEKENFEILKEIPTEGMCYGVSSFDGGLAVSLKIDTRLWQIEILDTNGSVLKVFKDNDNGVELFGYPDYIAMETDGSRLYVADGEHNAIICFDIENSTMTLAEELFRYKDKHLKIPKGLTTDGFGNLFIVGCASNNVHKISTSGKKLGEVLKHEEEVKTPMGICYDKAERKIFVTEGSRRVMIFKDG